MTKKKFTFKLDKKASDKTYRNYHSQNNELGFALNRHFEGRNCYQQAESWCNYLLNNPPWRKRR